MSAITTHILDTSLGRPAKNVAVELSFSGKVIASGTTNDDGRISDLLAEDHKFKTGTYQLNFKIGRYFTSMGIDCFYPEATIIFEVKDSSQHYHVPLLLNPFGYSTYRGS
jgi:5-hydroxyisourate hydrolase